MSCLKAMGIWHIWHLNSQPTSHELKSLTAKLLFNQGIKQDVIEMVITASITIMSMCGNLKVTSVISEKNVFELTCL